MKKKLPIIITSIIILTLIIIGFFIALKSSNNNKQNVEIPSIPEIPEIVLRDNGVPRFVEGSIINTKVKSNSDVFSALNVAFNIISHPTYYYFNGNSIIKKEYPEVAINIPDIVYNDILASITNEYCINREISVTQFANLLHLIYLSCK